MKYLILLVLVLFVGCEKDSTTNIEKTSNRDINDNFVIQYSPEAVKWDNLRDMINQPIDDERYIEDDKIMNIVIRFYSIPYSEATYDRIGVSVSSSSPPPYTQKLTTQYTYNEQEVSQEFVDEYRKKIDQIKKEESKIIEQNLKEILLVFHQRNDLSKYPEIESSIKNITISSTPFSSVNIKLRKDEIQNFIELNQGLIVRAHKNSHINENFIEGKIYPDFVYDNNSTKQKIYNTPNTGLILNAQYHEIIKDNEVIKIPMPNFKDSTHIIPTKESLDTLLEEQNKTITTALNDTAIDFTQNSIVIVYHSFSCVKTPQVFISIKDENNATIKIKARPTIGTVCSPAMTPITKTFIVSKDILIVNGEDNF